MASCGCRRCARARVAERQGRKALMWRAGVSAWSIRTRSSLGTSGNCPRRLLRIANPQGTRHFASSSRRHRHGHEALTGSARRIAFVSVRAGQSDALGVEPRRIAGETADQLRRLARGKPQLECRRQVDRVRRDRPGQLESLMSSPPTGSPIKPVTLRPIQQRWPSWSLDDQWIYFASDRTGDYQIWKMPSIGGTPKRITRKAA